MYAGSNFLACAQSLLLIRLYLSNNILQNCTKSNWDIRVDRYKRPRISQSNNICTPILDREIDIFLNSFLQAGRIFLSEAFCLLLTLYNFGSIISAANIFLIFYFIYFLYFVVSSTNFRRERIKTKIGF